MRTREHGQFSGAQLGSLIGAIAGTLFILINAGGIGGAAAFVRVTGIVLFVAALRWGVIRAPNSAPGQLSPRAGRIYWVSVAAEVVAIPVGAAIISRVFDRPELTVLWVVAVVGLHFLPFSRAFETPLYGWLGATMILLAVVGAAVTVAAGSDSAPSWFAVVAGVTLLAFSAAGPHIVTRSVTSAHP